MKSPKDKISLSSESNGAVLLNGATGQGLLTKSGSSKKKTLEISTTTTMQQYVELRKQQQTLQLNVTTAIRPQHPIAIDMTQFSLSPLACRITTTIDYSILQTKNDDILWSKSSPNQKLQQQKKVVRFATNQNVTVLYDVDTIVLSKKAHVALFWYTAQDYARFRTESNDLATYACGDLDYQQFFVNTLYPYCCHMATNISAGTNSYISTIGSNDATPVSPTDSDSDSTISLYSNSSSTVLTDNDSCGSSISSSNSSVATSTSLVDTTNTAAVDTVELEMMSKYRGLERIIFRHILQDLKIDYIKRCVKEEAENCYLDDDESDMVLDDSFSGDICMTESTNASTTGNSTGNSSNFRHYLYTSQIIAQFVGQIDHIAVVQDNQEYFRQQHKLKLKRLKLARDQKKSKAKWNTGGNDGSYSYENFHKQTIEI